MHRRYLRKKGVDQAYVRRCDRASAPPEHMRQRTGASGGATRH
ncbi:hypothetical protein BURMUCGD1_4124 [Burkholderia multivorans CGD1]|nr:hypothetical protein BURMUCGD1_4124 [Burkholderia multivorans CGD1]